MTLKRCKAIAAVVMYLLLASGSAGGSGSVGPILPRPGAHAPVGLRVVRQQVSVILAPALRQAIARHFPGYRLPVREFALQMHYDVKNGRSAAEAVRFVCTGDFDGNGLPDVALYLIQTGAPHHYRHRRIPRRRWLFVAFHQVARGAFRPYVLDRRYDPEFWRNEYTEALNRISDDAIALQPRGSRVHYFLRRGEVTGPLRLGHDGIAEYTDDGEVVFVFYFRRGRYHAVNVAGDE